MKTSWGNIINAVRLMHIQFYEQFPYPYQDIQLKTEFFAPPALSSVAPWEPLELPEKLSDVIEMNSVERVLMECPLSPFEEISIQNESEVGFLFKQILMLEREWLAQMKLVNPETEAWLDQGILKLTRQFGTRPRLKVVT